MAEELLEPSRIEVGRVLSGSCRHSSYYFENSTRRALTLTLP